MNNSQIYSIYSNPDYDYDNFKSINMTIINSQIGALQCGNGTFAIKNSNFSEGIEARFSIVDIENVYSKHSSSNIYNSFYASNITIKSSYFDSSIYANACNLNMTYSVMLGEMVVMVNFQLMFQQIIIGGE